MIKDKETAAKTAGFLLEIKAVKLNKNTPFTWASGWKSPIYCDNRKTLSYPHIRTYLSHEFSRLIREEFQDVELIAGVATGAIAIGVLVAQELGKPFVYVRSGNKDHGLKNKIEGVMEKGSKVVVLEDLISTGGSSLAAVDALKDAGARVLGMAAIFTYGFSVARERFDEAGVKLFTLSDYSHLLDKALESGYIGDEDLESLKVWRQNPAVWGK